MMERNAWKHGSSTGWKVALVLVLGGFALSDLVWAPEDATAQIQFQFRRQLRVGQQPENETTDGVFLPQDRDATRQLERAKQLLEEDRYSDAATLLDDILKRGEDYFFKPDDSKQVHRSLKMEAQRLIGKMPPEGLKAYELLFGTRAQQMLNEAAAEGDIAKLESVARRFFHTPAGYQATLLLGRRYLDHSQPLAAAFCFQRLLDTPHAAAQFEPGLSVLTALSWQRGGMTDRAGESLVALRKQNPKATVRLGTTKIPAFPDGKTAVTWLQSTFGNPTRTASSDLDQWAMHRGNPSRNSIGTGGIPLLNPRWRVSTTNHPMLEKTLVEARKRYAEDSIPSLPVMQPLAVGNLVLMRTPREVLAVDFVTGKRLWPIRTSDSAWGARANSELPMLGPQAVETQNNSWLTDRFWVDATQGTMSSDGTRLFLIQDSVDRAERRNNSENRFGMQFEMAKPYNRLTACDLQTQGKLKWQVGGPLGEDEPQLAGAFFLGPPLPLQGKAYALAEINGEIKLCVLDAETGRLEWSQQLAVVEQTIMQDGIRMLAGCTPSFADGVLVCPTTAGAVVAVDMTNRSLLWAFQYPRSIQQAMRGNLFGVPPGGGGHNERWTDSAVIIADGRVIVSPLESDDLYCLSLVDGKPLWNTVQRGENLYVGGVHGGKVVLVGKRSVNALRLADGKPAWKKPVELPDAALPSGRGYLSGNEYYLPLTTAEVVRIDLPTEKITHRAKSRTGSIPGNLVCYRGEVISQGVDYLESFFQLEPLEKRIADALAGDPENAWALAHRSEIALNGNELTPERLEQAVADIRRAYSIEPSPFTRDLFVETYTTALARDFGKYHSLVAELEPLVRFDQERSKYLRVIAAGLHQQGKTSAALDAYLKLAELQLPLDDELDDVEAKRKVRRDRWIRANVNELITAASAEERAKIDAVIDARLELAAADRGPKLLRSFLSYFADQPAADRARELLLEQTTGPTVLLEREQLLRKLEQSSDATRRKEAAVRLAALLRDAGQEEAALSIYRQLEKEFGDAPLIEGKSVKAMLDALPTESPLRRAATRAPGLPAGEVLVEKGSGRAARNSAYGPVFLPIEFRGLRGPFFEDVTVSYQNSGELVGRDGWGAERFRLLLNEGQRGYGNMMVNSACVASYGHLLVLCTGNQVMAIDTLRSADGSAARILWRQDIGEANAGNQYFDGTGRARNIRGRSGSRGSQMGCLGPVSASGVVVQRARDVIAFDPFTGKPLWTRQVDAANCDLFGDEEIVIVAPPAGGDAKALVLRAIDGNLLGTCSLPPANLRWMALGRHLLVQNSTPDGKLILKLIDPWGNRDVWSQTFSANVKSTLIDDDTIAIMQPDGRFVEVSLADGSITLDANLAAEKNLENIYVIRSAEQDLLVVSQPADTRQSGRQRRTVPQQYEGVPIVTGRIYAFDRATGKPQWAVPGAVEEHGLVLGQPSELPVLIFMRTVVESNGDTQSQRGSILCIDKRTGRPIYEDDNLQQNVGTFDVVAHVDEKTVVVNVPQQSWTLKFTGKPVAPEPPYGAGFTEAEPVKMNRDPFAPGK